MDRFILKFYIFLISLLFLLCWYILVTYIMFKYDPIELLTEWKIPYLYTRDGSHLTLQHDAIDTMYCYLSPIFHMDEYSEFLKPDPIVAKVEAATRLSNWQYWWWFWFCFGWGLYDSLFQKVVIKSNNRSHIKINSSIRSHSKFGDFIACTIPIFWVINIIFNSNSLLKMLEWQSDSTYLNVRIRAKQWYWLYYYDLKNLVDFSTFPKKFGWKNWIIGDYTKLKKFTSFSNSVESRSREFNSVFEYWDEKISELIKLKHLRKDKFTTTGYPGSFMEFTDKTPLEKKKYINKINHEKNFKIYFDYTTDPENLVPFDYYGSFLYTRWRAICKYGYFKNEVYYNNWVDSFNELNLSYMTKRIPRSGSLRNIREEALKEYLLEIERDELFSSKYYINSKKIIFKPYFNSNKEFLEKTYYNHLKYTKILKNKLDRESLPLLDRIKFINFITAFGFKNETLINEISEKSSLLRESQLNLTDLSNKNTYSEKSILGRKIQYPSFDNLSPDSLDGYYFETQKSNNKFISVKLNLNNSNIDFKFDTHNNKQNSSLEYIENRNFILLSQKRLESPDLISSDFSKITEKIDYKKSNKIQQLNSFILYKNKKHQNFFLENKLLKKTFYDPELHNKFLRTSYLPLFKGVRIAPTEPKRLFRLTKTLILPTLTSINVITNSYDVIHSWFVPSLGIKFDCVPGKSTHHTLYLEGTGFFYGQCAEVCGRYHHHMPIKVFAVSLHQFITWWTHVGLFKVLGTNAFAEWKKWVEHGRVSSESFYSNKEAYWSETSKPFLVW